MIKVKTKAGAGEAVAAAKKFPLKRVRKSTEAGEQTVLRLKPKKRRDSRRIFRLLRRGKDLRANPSVKFTDAAGDIAVEKRVVRLKPKKRRR